MADSDIYNELNWSSSEYSLKELIDKYSLPQIVKVEEGYMLSETQSLGSGQLMTIHSWKTMTQLKGTDAMGRDVIIPITCPFKVKLATRNQGKIFKSVRELCEANPRPKYVHVKIKKKKKAEKVTIKNGDKLKVLLIERTTNGPSFMHFRNEERKHLRLPVEYAGEFKQCPEDTKEYILSELIGREFPIFVQFVIDGGNKTVVDKSVGVIEIRESITTNLVFATTRDRGKVNLLAFPLSLDVKVRAVQDMAQDKTEYTRMCDLNCKGEQVEKLQKQISCKDPVNSTEVYITSYAFEALKAAEASKDKSPKKSPTNGAITSNNDTFEYPVNSDLPELPKEDDQLSTIESVSSDFYERPLNVDAQEKRKSGDKNSLGFISRIRSKLKRKPEKSPKSPNLASQSKKINKLEIEVLHHHNDTSSEGGDSGIYEEIPHDVYMSMDVLDGLKRAYSTQHISQPRQASTSTKSRTKFNPPPLPGNHPITRRNTLPAKPKGGKEAIIQEESDKKVFQAFYDTLKKSEKEITRWNSAEFNNALNGLQLGKYVDTLAESQIDGKLLVDLDEAIFKDLGMNPFEARKLRKFVFGWRPDSMKTTYQEMSTAKNNKNLEPCDWTESDVVFHLNQLSMETFANFCKASQVNGDLLRDIVLDNEVLSFVLKGKDKRLNSVKLKNYVIEGWRPREKPKRTASTNAGYINMKPLSSQRDKTHIDSVYVDATRIVNDNSSSRLNENRSSPSQTKLKVTRSASGQSLPYQNKLQITQTGSGRSSPSQNKSQVTRLGSGGRSSPSQNKSQTMQSESGRSPSSQIKSQVTRLGSGGRSSPSQNKSQVIQSGSGRISPSQNKSQITRTVTPVKSRKFDVTSRIDSRRTKSPVDNSSSVNTTSVSKALRADSHSDQASAAPKSGPKSGINLTSVGSIVKTKNSSGPESKELKAGTNKAQTQRKQPTGYVNVDAAEPLKRSYTTGRSQIKQINDGATNTNQEDITRRSKTFSAKAKRSETGKGTSSVTENKIKVNKDTKGKDLSKAVSLKTTTCGSEKGRKHETLSAAKSNENYSAVHKTLSTSKSIKPLKNDRESGKSELVLSSVKRDLDCGKTERPAISNLRKQYEDPKPTTRQLGNETTRILSDNKKDISNRKNMAKPKVVKPKVVEPQENELQTEERTSVADMRKRFDIK